MRVYRAVLIVLILMSHFLIRDSAARMVPLNARGNYPEEYGVAISLAFGKGFHALSQIQPFQPNTGLLIPEAPEARPLVRFLRWGQDSLSPNELEAYFRTVYSPTAASPLASTRILELRVAGVLWKIFAHCACKRRMRAPERTDQSLLLCGLLPGYERERSGLDKRL